MAKRILVAGSSNIDFLLSTPYIPAPGETMISSGKYAFTPGGKGANQAMALAKTGCNVKMLGAVGKDLSGELAINNLKSFGIDTTDVLLKSGAGILEINAVRRHISQFNGGMLAKRIAARGAELIGFGISDAVGTPATGDIGEPYKAYKGTPMGPDQTTLEDARRVIRDYDVADRLPKAVVDYLMNVGEEGETPKAFPQNTYFLLNTLPDSCIYAKKVAEEMGIPAIILSSFLEGESKDAGTIFASIAREVQSYGNPLPAPCVILSSGETTTKILDNREITGHGGSILSSVTGGGYDRLSGTSMACPNVSGLVAILRQYVRENFPAISDNNVEIAAVVNRLLILKNSIVYHWSILKLTRK